MLKKPAPGMPGAGFFAFIFQKIDSTLGYWRRYAVIGFPEVLTGTPVQHPL